MLISKHAGAHILGVNSMLTLDFVSGIMWPVTANKLIGKSTSRFGTQHVIAHVRSPRALLSLSAMTTCNVTGGNAPLVWAPE